MNYEFYADITDKEYLQFNLYHNKTSKEQKKTRNFIYIILFALLILESVYFAVVDPEGWLYYSLVPIIVIAVIIPVSNIITRCALRFHVRTMKKNGKLPYEKSNIDFYDDYLIDRSEFSESKTDYSAICKVADNKKNGAIYLYITSISAILLPYRLFKSDAERENFLEFINEKINK